MKLVNFNPADGSFDYIANDDGSPAITFYQLGNHGTHFQVVTGGEGSVNFDAKTPDAEGDVNVGLWPQHKGVVYIQSETRANWLSLSPSDPGGDVVVRTGGAPYTHRVGMSFHFQAGGTTKLDQA
jgi:hypothetical protein